MAENREPSGIAKNPIDLLAEKLGMTRDGVTPKKNPVQSSGYSFEPAFPIKPREMEIGFTPHPRA